MWNDLYAVDDNAPQGINTSLHHLSRCVKVWFARCKANDVNATLSQAGGEVGECHCF